MQGIVLGMTGSGKTTLLKNIITQDIARFVGPPEDRHHIPMVIFDGKGDLEFFEQLLPHIHRAGRLHQLRLLNPSRPEFSALYNPFFTRDDNYMAQVNMIFGSFNLHDEFFAKHQLNYLGDIVRVLFYTGARYNFYDVIVMLLDQDVLKEQIDKAVHRLDRDSNVTAQQRLNFEMSVKNLTQSLEDRERVPKIQGLINECMTFLDDELSAVTGQYDDLLSIEDVIDQELILFVSLNSNKNIEPVRSLGKMLLQNIRVLSVSLRKEGRWTYFWEESPRIRRTEVRPTRRRRAISALAKPARCSLRISAACLAAVAGRPSRLPFCRACAKPARVRSPRISRSNAAKTASSPAIARPAGVVRSSASVSDTKPTPRCSSSCSVASRSVTDRPQRSRRHTSTTSISRRRAASSSFSRASRFAAPEPTSRTFTAMVQPRRAAYSRMARLCMGSVC
jgi:hypothetical protein